MVYLSAGVGVGGRCGWGDSEGMDGSVRRGALWVAGDLVRCRVAARLGVGGSLVSTF